MPRAIHWVAGLLLTGVVLGKAGAAEIRPVPVYVNGGRLSSDALMVTEAGRTVLPMRALFTSLGARVEWDARERAVYAWTPDGSGVRFEVGERQAQIMEMADRPQAGDWGKVVGRRTLDVPALVVQDRVYIPIRAAGESLNADVRWVASTPAVYIATGAVAGTREETPLEVDPAPENDRPARPAATAAQIAQALDVRLVIGEQVFPRGETVPLQLVVTNQSQRPVVVPFGSGQQFDFEVVRNGTVVWNWARDRAFTQVFSTMTLQPGERMVYETSWAQRNNQGNRVRPGLYTVRGVVTPAFPRLRPADEKRIEIVE